MWDNELWKVQKINKMFSRKVAHNFKPSSFINSKLVEWKCWQQESRWCNSQKTSKWSHDALQRCQLNNATLMQLHIWETRFCLILLTWTFSLCQMNKWCIPNLVDVTGGKKMFHDDCVKCRDAAFKTTDGNLPLRSQSKLVVFLGNFRFCCRMKRCFLRASGWV